MKKELIKTEINVNNNKIEILRIGDTDYISLNAALFGMTAKEWRENNPELVKEGNIRDYTDLVHMVILNNLENIFA